MGSQSVPALNRARSQKAAAAKNGLCATPQCSQPAVTSLAFQDLCIAHFISHAYALLDQCAVGENKSSTQLLDEGSLRLFLGECSRRIVDLCLAKDDLDNLQRACLFDILLWVGDLAEELSGRYYQ